MSSVVINYNMLDMQIKYSNNCAKACTNYANALQSKVSASILSVDGGQNGNTSNADYYVKQKIAKLNTKSDNYSAFAKKLEKLSEKAKTVDKSVATMINERKESFIKRHDFVKVSAWQDFINWLIDVKNSCPLFKMIGDWVCAAFDVVTSVLDELKYWYRYCGGKEIWGEIKAFLGVILAVVAFICTLPASGFLAVCAAIAAAITLVSAIAKFVTSTIAAERAQNGDPCWARFYSKQTTIQDVLRKNNWGNKTLNWMSNIGATVIDVTEVFCNIVNVVGMVKDVVSFAKEIKRIGNLKTQNPLKVVKDYIFNKGEHYRGRNAKLIREQGLRTYIQSRESWQKVKFKELKKFGKYVKKVVDFGDKVVNFLFEPKKVEVSTKNKTGGLNYKDFGIGRAHDGAVDTVKDAVNRWKVNVDSYAGI